MRERRWNAQQQKKTSEKSVFSWILHSWDDKIAAMPALAEKQSDFPKRLLMGLMWRSKNIARQIISRAKSLLPADRHATDGIWDTPYATLKKKWVEVPTYSNTSVKTTKLLELSDEVLLSEWMNARRDLTTGPEFAHRGWYYALYADSMRGKKLLDVGSGFGFDSITYAQHGAAVTFVDLVESNLEVLRRLCALMALTNVRFHLLSGLESLKGLDRDYDIIMAMGSLHHAPARVIQPECRELLSHLKVGGRWLQFAYPKTRWLRQGSPAFDKWGPMTDGPGTPWAEWYDVPKLLGMLEPAKFEVVLYQEFHDGDFNWFDLLKL